MTDLFSSFAAVDTGEDMIAAEIAAGTVDRKLLNEVMTRVCGASDATGAWTQRDSFELLERGLEHFHDGRNRRGIPIEPIV
ncbi:hypothetical protein HNO88_004422 [Novosphingobium chloroacetimidivorans]|uniref:Uncharacterized protein n=1 Tax=Novosphingobium chloroacetimidivorans TaxID=1428314 RepID=A0A7W7KDY6_9SPHN|nr:hypothetical protein [Novosphingobium chloroacetimidivorans]MBB4861074.1 hypothetical protein [Novosphingobium chloroacetimidivorans]